MKNDCRQKLIELGAETLADALLELAVHSDTADDLIERLTATPAEKMKKFKTKLSGLKRARRFIDWRGTGGLAKKLSGLWPQTQLLGKV